MKLLLRLVVALYAGFLVSSLLHFMWGEAGISQLRTIREHRDRLIGNIEDLEDIHNELILERDALLYDTSEIEARARQFGYFREDEVPVMLPDSPANAKSRMLGTLLRETPSSHGGSGIFRLFFLVTAFAVFAASFLWGKHGTNHSGG